ncbi:invasion protein [Ruegeria sp. ANG-S4]|uniref:invasion associated locus B family protein n=1 Tax=Ruegeria sp. ANG-S4 TaxID=1577904 RepID=UPI00057D2286|nr:invasion associated locus B family protein [Ruegeria sp. ANG-S4]KIC44806.1 invasion protein [Ruegeria sp. ANG-S4]
MIRKLVPFNLIAAALWCSVAHAQESTQTEAAETEAPATQQADPNDLDLGEEGPRVGQQYAKDTSGDWEVSCFKTENDNDPCALRQILTGEQGQPIAEMTVQKLPEGSAAAAAATVVVPLETHLPSQLALSIDGAPGKRYNYHHCNPVGCLVQLGFTQGDLDALKAGNKAIISLVSVLAPTQVLEIDVSLSGFTAGFDGLPLNQN